MTQHKLTSLVLILTAILMVSCRKTHYGTSLAMQNHLDEEIEVEVETGELGRNLGAMISVLTVAVQQILDELKLKEDKKLK